MSIILEIQLPMALSSINILFALTFATFSLLPTYTLAQNGCGKETVEGECYNRPKAQTLKLIAIASILVTSLIGVSLPLFSRALPALRPDRKFFMVVKAFASGVILATGFMHVLPDSFLSLSSPCLPEVPWRTFSFTGFFAMVSAIFTLMVDSFMMTFHSRRRSGTGRNSVEVVDHATPPEVHAMGVLHPPKDEAEHALMRNRTIAQVLEMGIVVHSIVIGLSMGASQNVCTIRPLVAALCFHQMFEGMGLGGCILQAEYGFKMKAILVFFFSVTTPFGVALGIGLSNVYSDNSPTALIVIGLLNASSAGLLIYMALVDLLAADFMGPRLQSSATLQGWCYVAVLLGAAGMSVMAKWA